MQEMVLYIFHIFAFTDERKVVDVDLDKWAFDFGFLRNSNG